jgi:hypothetical protein
VLYRHLHQEHVNGKGYNLVKEEEYDALSSASPSVVRARDTQSRTLHSFKMSLLPNRPFNEQMLLNMVVLEGRPAAWIAESKWAKKLAGDGGSGISPFAISKYSDDVHDNLRVRILNLIEKADGVAVIIDGWRSSHQDRTFVGVGEFSDPLVPGYLNSCSSHFSHFFLFLSPVPL